MQNERNTRSPRFQKSRPGANPGLELRILGIALMIFSVIQLVSERYAP
jgi:hypothetical protein